MTQSVIGVNKARELFQIKDFPGNLFCEITEKYSYSYPVCPRYNNA